MLNILLIGQPTLSYLKNLPLTEQCGMKWTVRDLHNNISQSFGLMGLCDFQTAWRYVSITNVEQLFKQEDLFKYTVMWEPHHEISFSVSAFG